MNLGPNSATKYAVLIPGYPLASILLILLLLSCSLGSVRHVLVREKSVYQWMIKHQTAVKTNKMFLPGRMAFIFDMENVYTHDIPTVLHRSKADYPLPEETVTVNVDGSILDRIGKIMPYLRLGSSGKVLKKKKKEKQARDKFPSVINEYEGDPKPFRANGLSSKNYDGENLPPPLPFPKGANLVAIEKQIPVVARTEDDDIFVGDGVDHEVPKQ